MVPDLPPILFRIQEGCLRANYVVCVFCCDVGEVQTIATVRSLSHSAINRLGEILEWGGSRVLIGRS